MSYNCFRLRWARGTGVQQTLRPADAAQLLLLLLSSCDAATLVPHCVNCGYECDT